MNLKLKNSCNLINTLLKHRHEVLSVTLNSQTVQNELYCQFHTKDTDRNFNGIHESMDKFSEQCSKESIKKTMLKHEKIFKQQVRELHRLYHVQKKLMKELRGEEVRMAPFVEISNPQIVLDASNKLRSSRTSSETTHSSCDRHNSFAVLNSATEFSHVLPELINCSEPLRASKGRILQHHIDGLSKELCSKEEFDLDLSLSIGCAADKMRSEEDRKEIIKGSKQLLSSTLILEESGKECANSSGGFGAESLKRPHWLFQALSLNRT